MKKTFYAFSLLAFFLIFSTSVSAQTITVSNGTNCNLQVQGVGLNNFCNQVCGMLPQTVPAMMTQTFPMVCSAAAPPPIHVIGIWDPSTGSGVRVGNGCGAPTFGTIIDCQGFTRTVAFSAPNSVFVF